MTGWPAHVLRFNMLYLALGLVLFTGAVWPVPINHDSAFLYLAGERLINGQSLYLDQSLNSPPLGYWLHAGAVLVSRWLVPIGVHVLLPLTVVIIALALMLSERILRVSSNLTPTHRAGMVWAGFVALAVAPIADLGQRDHVFAVFAYPYVLMLGLRFDDIDVPRPLAITVGVFAFFGIALKPHFLLLPLVLVITQVIRTRRWTELFRAETLTLAVCLGVYALSVVLFYPEYFTDVLPRYVSVFGAFTQPLNAVLQKLEVILAMMAVVAYVIERAHVRFGRGIVMAVLIATVVCVVIFVLQKKGWTYQRAPALMFTTMVVLALAITCSAPKSVMESSAKVLVWAVLICIGYLLVVRGPYQNAHQDRGAQAVVDLARGQSAYVFTSNVSFPYPTFLYQDVTPASRFDTLWMIPALAIAASEGQDLNAIKPVDQYLRQTILQDFQRHKPYVVAVDERAQKPYFNGVAFDYLNWALNDPRFGAEWDHYTFVKKTYDFAIYVRNP